MANSNSIAHFVGPKGYHREFSQTDNILCKPSGEAPVCTEGLYLWLEYGTHLYMNLASLAGQTLLPKEGERVW